VFFSIFIQVLAEMGKLSSSEIWQSEPENEVITYRFNLISPNLYKTCIKKVKLARPPTNNSRQRRTEHRFYAEIATDITTRNPERKDT
jgi:hypothetical protein